MTLSKKSDPYIIPEYSLTGDLLSYQRCGLQYRYQNRGALPPSTPIQLWFGEFIHGVMEESYKTWRTDPDSFRFPWSWETEIRPIEMNVNRRLMAKGLLPTRQIFCPYDENMNTPGICPDANHPHKLLASKRAEAAINTWGPHLFPLIDNAEVKLKGCRKMIDNQEDYRSDTYGIKGIIDVISSVSIRDFPSENLIIKNIIDHPEIQALINEHGASEYEIIIDYKGMRRPPKHQNDGELDPTWEAHAWQVLTYAWLRSRQLNAKRPIAGIIFYLNELFPSNNDIKDLKQELKGELTDIKPTDPEDKQTLELWKNGSKNNTLSTELREKRCIRLIPITEERQQQSLLEFDQVVAEIERSIVQEMRCGSISECWQANPNDEKTCTACDFKLFCPAKEDKYRMTVP